MLKIWRIWCQLYRAWTTIKALFGGLLSLVLCFTRKFTTYKTPRNRVYLPGIVRHFILFCKLDFHCVWVPFRTYEVMIWDSRVTSHHRHVCFYGEIMSCCLVCREHMTFVCFLSRQNLGPDFIKNFSWLNKYKTR